MLGGGVKNATVSVCVCVCACVYNFFGRTTGRILTSDSSLDRKCPKEKTVTIVDIDFFRKSISIDRYIIYEHESGNILSKIDIDRPKIDISIDRY